MALYVMFGRYSSEAVRQISAERTKKTEEFIKRIGGKINAIYALLGGYDLVMIMELPDNKAVMKASLGLTKLLGISFNSFPAVTVEEFDKVAKDV